MSAKPGAPRVLHIHGSFAADSPAARRCGQLIDAFGGRLAHTIIAANGDWSAADALARGIAVRRLSDFPALGGLPLPGRLQRIARAMQDFDLVLTYGRGAVDAALAHTMFSKVHALPPLIHHEDGSDESARQRRGFRSKWYRRIGLGKASGLVVPTETMEHAALVDWQQPLGRVKTISDGVNLKRFARAPKPDAIARLLKRPGELWLGCLASAGSEDDVIALMHAMGALPPEWHMVIVGGSVERDRFEAAASRHGLDHRVHLVSETADHAAAMALFDVVAIPRVREPLPLAVIEAMAAGKPVVVFDTGEAGRGLGPDNAQLIADETPAGALERLAGDRFLRQRIGMTNREKAEAERDEAAMVAAYRRLYSSALGRDAI